MPTETISASGAVLISKILVFSGFTGGFGISLICAPAAAVHRLSTTIPTKVRPNMFLLSNRLKFSRRPRDLRPFAPISKYAGAPLAAGNSSCDSRRAFEGAGPTCLPRSLCPPRVAENNGRHLDGTRGTECKLLREQRGRQIVRRISARQCRE